jgi:uncharacterized protein YkwD
MRNRLTGTIAVASIAAGPGAPAAAQAQQQCVFQGVKASAGTAGKVERSLLCLTNLHRVRNGLAALERDTRLGAAARGHSADMVARNYFDHVTPEGAGPSQRAQAAGYPGGAGENIAANGNGSAFSLFDQWRNSAGHNQNMLTAGYVAAGFGVARGFPGPGAGVTGTQMFGFMAANSGDTGLDLYASSAKCAKAKLTLIKAKRKKKGKKKRSRKQRRKLAKAKRLRKRTCKPLA